MPITFSVLLELNMIFGELNNLCRVGLVTSNTWEQLTSVFEYEVVDVDHIDVVVNDPVYIRVPISAFSVVVDSRAASLPSASVSARTPSHLTIRNWNQDPVVKRRSPQASFAERPEGRKSTSLRMLVKPQKKW